MEHRDEVFLMKVLSEIEIADKMMGDRSLPEFGSDEMCKRAVCMTVINIGELKKNLSDTCRKDNPSVPWKAIAGFRDVAAHKYQTLRMEDVYETVQADLPLLHEQTQKILADT